MVVAGCDGVCGGKDNTKSTQLQIRHSPQRSNPLIAENTPPLFAPAHPPRRLILLSPHHKKAYYCNKNTLYSDKEHPGYFMSLTMSLYVTRNVTRCHFVTLLLCYIKEVRCCTREGECCNVALLHCCNKVVPMCRQPRGAGRQNLTILH